MAYLQSAEDAYSFDTTPANFRDKFSNDISFYKENLPNRPTSPHKPNSLPYTNQTSIPNFIDQPYQDIFLFTNYHENRKLSQFSESNKFNYDSFSIFNPNTFEIQFNNFNKFSLNNREHCIKKYLFCNYYYIWGKDR